LTYNRILDAAERLLRKEDIDAIRMEALLEEAGVSVGSFYARFQGKEALFSGLVIRYREDVEAFVNGPVDIGARNLEEACRARVTSQVSRFRKRRELLRFLVTHHRTRAQHAAILRELASRVNEWTGRFFEPFHDEIDHPDPAKAIQTGVYFMAAICRDRILFGNGPHSSTVSLTISTPIICRGRRSTMSPPATLA
jgi:AcrR family transcriptional regulator